MLPCRPTVSFFTTALRYRRFAYAAREWAVPQRSASPTAWPGREAVTSPTAVGTGLAHGRTQGHLGRLQIEAARLAALLEDDAQELVYFARDLLANRFRRFFPSGASVSSTGRAWHICVFTSMFGSGSSTPDGSRPIGRFAPGDQHVASPVPVRDPPSIASFTWRSYTLGRGAQKKETRYRRAFKSRIRDKTPGSAAGGGVLGWKGHTLAGT